MVKGAKELFGYNLGDNQARGTGGAQLKRLKVPFHLSPLKTPGNAIDSQWFYS
ncbi:hypothetical protein MGG_18012 [Pyricularia oryzae 70-15]|uniref:Uncharacterized protein n=2 Tax=Pyricularia oryzae TaxID=318829 RepID=G4NJL2_PYRO7|nr:uncharacterized protein MGG_18012 [Pyricularia oryzae 70-15]EHA46428.1 hypothetical protein MGG_18012 [Pyricularia oryzae 70-15]KAI7929982.1 hypothetical protein M9X92_001100 [Pyricularia oryzae]KAI7930482.1 hypothetical protein M0657_001602 [Pyricularia oryzae]QBZ66177.1 hypothetical protein PoMZ_13148 [Pyricularia oryzae]